MIKTSKTCSECGSSMTKMRFAARRGFSFGENWSCSAACVRSSIANQLSRIERFRPPVHKHMRAPLGLALLHRGLINHAQLKKAIEAQYRGGGKLGAYLMAHAGASETDIATTVASQWSVPFLEVSESAASKGTGYIPLELLRCAEAMIAHVDQSRKVLHLAFAAQVDHALAYAIEQVSRMKVICCIARQSVVAEWLRRQKPHSQTLLPRCADYREASEVLTAYVERHHGCDVTLATVGSTAWVRIEGSRPLDLLCAIGMPTGSAIPRSLLPHFVRNAEVGLQTS